MTRFNLFLAIVFLAGGTIFTRSATAQYSYAPLTPAMSPWMGLWQKNTGALDNYHTFVQPQMQLNATLQMQNAALTRQAAGLQELNYAISQPQGSQSGMMPTGQGATFMSYSHYYGGSRQFSSLSRPAASRVAGPKMPANIRSIPGVVQ